MRVRHPIGLTIYPPYPEGFFKNPSMKPYSYQNGGDWTWFGGRLIQTLIDHGFVEEAYRELLPMVARVQANDGFYEWYSVDNQPRGSGTFRGSAGVLGKAIEMLIAWAKAHANQAPLPWRGRPLRAGRGLPYPARSKSASRFQLRRLSRLSPRPLPTGEVAS